VIGPSIGTAGPAPVPTVDTLQFPPRTGTVNSNGPANVRGDPSTTNKPVGQVPSGAQLNILGEQGDWLHVSGTGWDGKPIDGWISKGLVKEAERQDPRVASRMESLGYVQHDGKVDDLAVHNFQAMNGLPVGPMDDATLAAMWSADAKVNTHVMQFTNARWNPTGPGSSNNCGPASVSMALAAAGIKPIDPADPEAAIDASRALTGGTKSDTTGSGQLTTAITGQGGQAYSITNMDQMQMAVSSGDPVVLFGYEQKNTDYRGAHWVAVVGYDKATDSFLVSDPLASDGVQRWSRADMQAYANFSVSDSVAVHNPNG
jgi:peptidase C39-like protein/SH3 domain-containing protein